MLGYAGKRAWITPGCRLKAHHLCPNASVQSRLSCETPANVLLIRKSLGRLLSYHLSRGRVSPGSRTSTHLGFASGRFDRSTVSTNPDANAWEAGETPPYSLHKLFPTRTGLRGLNKNSP